MHEKVCPTWIGYILLNPLRKIFENPDRLFSPFVKEGMVVFEPGCGMGYFTLPLARMVGPQGRVVAADIQEKMLAALERRARKAGLSKIIEPRLVKPGGMDLKDLEGAVDFVAAIHMVHEVPDKDLFFREVITLMKSDGKMLVMEPKGHVSTDAFQKSIATAIRFGLSPDPLAFRIKDRRVVLHKVK